MTGTIGLGSYAFFWRHSEIAGEPMPLTATLAATRDAGLDLFQICDWAPLTGLTEAELDDAASAARDLGIRIQLGTKGIEPAHLDRFLRLADRFDARLVRSMLTGPGSSPSLTEAEAMLRRALPAFEAAGVVLALETYEQVASADLVSLIETVGSAALGICLDPANTVARLEHPRDVVERCAPYTRNVHVKDFAFTRRDGWVGFTLQGAPLGTGLLDLDHLLAAVDPAVDLIAEHWLPAQPDPADTLRLEAEWTDTTVTVLKEHLR